MRFFAELKRRNVIRVAIAYAIVCTDNPYAAVWQPAEGTCETFPEIG
jgi:hypothetical protein